MLGLGVRDQGRAPLGGRFASSGIGSSSLFTRKMATTSSRINPAAKPPTISSEGFWALLSVLLAGAVVF